MSAHVRTRPARLAALATGAVLSLSLVAAPTSVAAQATPEEAVNGVLTAIEEWRFEDIPMYFCAEQAGAAAALDFGGPISAFFAGVPPDQLQAAVRFSIADPIVEILEQDESSARVRLRASVDISVDETIAREIVLALFASLGQDDPPDVLIDNAVRDASAGLAAQGQEIDEEADLVLEEEVWKVCSAVGPGAIGAGAGGASEDTDTAPDATDDVTEDPAATQEPPDGE